MTPLTDEDTYRRQREDVASARIIAAQVNGQVFICHGPPRCELRCRVCVFCAVIGPHDPRTTDEILAAMERVH